VPSTGYWIASSDGVVGQYGDVALQPPASCLASDTVAGIATPDQTTVWLVTKQGELCRTNGAPFLGDLTNVALAKPVVGLVATPDGAGYWMVAADGGVFSFGDARFYGSMGGRRLNAPMVGIAATPDGAGVLDGSCRWWRVQLRRRRLRGVCRRGIRALPGSRHSPYPVTPLNCTSCAIYVAEAIATRYQTRLPLWQTAGFIVQPAVH
jgi:hypothetical protein